jgi:hypothetical protein
MILIYASQLDYEGMAGQATDLQVWSPEDFAAMGAFMEAFNGELVESGELIEARAFVAPAHTGGLAHGCRRSFRLRREALNSSAGEKGF